MCFPQFFADVPLPEGFIPPSEENDDLREETDPNSKEPEKWGELGLNTVR